MSNGTVQMVGFLILWITYWKKLVALHNLQQIDPWETNETYTNPKCIQVSFKKKKERKEKKTIQKGPENS